jgi:hypothetical protein
MRSMNEESHSLHFVPLAEPFYLKVCGPSRDMARLDEWARIQLPIMRALQFEGSEVRVFGEYDWGSGAYLLCNLQQFQVAIDVEDATSLEEVERRQVVSVEIYNRQQDTWHYGFVDNIDLAEQAVRLLEEDKFQDALRIIFRRKSGFPGVNYRKVRTDEELNSIVTRSLREETRG